MAKAATPAEITAFIAKVAPAAIQCWVNTRVMLPSITIAQAGLESGWGKSELSVKANNFFGVKVSNGWTGEYVEMMSPEVINGIKIMKLSKFRKYPDIYSSINDHNNFFTANRRRYSNIIGNTDFNSVRVLIQRDGYATDPEYPAKLLKIYNDNNLWQYDKMAGITPGVPVQTPVQTTIQQKPSATGSRIIYTVQAGAFSNPDNAQNMIRRAYAYGYNAYLIETGGLYKVQIGAFSSKANADKRVAELKSKGINAIIVQKVQ